MNTLRSQILFSITAVMISSSVGIMAFVYKKTNETVFKIEEKSIKNIQLFIEASLQDNFNYFLRSKFEYANVQRNILKINMDFILSLKINMNMETKKMVEYYIQSKKDSLAVQAMLFDEKGKILLHTDKKFISTNIRQVYSDLKANSNYSKNGQFVIFNKINIGYFVPITDKDKEMTLALFLEKNNFDVKAESTLKHIGEDLTKIINKITVANSDVESKGFIFVYKNKNEIIAKTNGIKEKCIEEIASSATITGDEKIENKIFKSCRGEYLSIYKKSFKGFKCDYFVVFPSGEMEKPANSLAVSILYIVTLISLLSFVFFAWLVSSAINPLSILSKKMMKLSTHNFTDNDHSELIDGLPVDVNNEIGKLAKTFSLMIIKLSDNIKQLVEKTEVNERIAIELKCARDIQFGTLRKDFSFSEKNIDIYAYLIPAREIGGDLYDFFFIDEDHLCFTVGDVADKGVPAAMFMVIAKKLISSNADKGCSNLLSPAEIMSRINEILCKDNPSFTFITLFIGILNVKNGELRYANGGHVPPIFTDCVSEPKYRKDLSGPLVGVMPGIRYKDIDIALQPGGAIFLCTDGVTEAMDEADKQFSDKRLLKDFCRMKDKSCKEVVEGILYEVENYRGKAPQSDDIAMLMVRWSIKRKDGENYA